MRKFKYNSMNIALCVCVCVYVCVREREIEWIMSERTDSTAIKNSDT
jgi:tRNA C32,U32 (ribose-2'-O)-methylase TrmJ